MLAVTFTAKPSAKTPARAYLVADDLALPVTDAYLSKALKAASFTGKKGESLTLVHPSGNPAIAIIVGLGKASGVSTHVLEEAGGSALASALAAKVTALEIHAGLPKSVKIDTATASAHLAFGA